MATKLALVVRTDLGMGRGKMAAQVAHAAVGAALASEGSPEFGAWLADGQPKVVLRVGTEQDLLDLVQLARDGGLAVDLVRDAGRTQVATGTLTCCALGPAEDRLIDAVAGHLSLL